MKFFNSSTPKLHSAFKIIEQDSKILGRITEEEGEIDEILTLVHSHYGLSPAFNFSRKWKIGNLGEHLK